MKVRCIPCNRSFDSDASLKQHKRTSDAHDFTCIPCNHRFNSEEALRQHRRDSRAHGPSFDCDDCNRPFNSEEALRQHLRDSRAHAPSFDCDNCHLSFDSEKALQQHLCDSPAYTPSFTCDNCEQNFASKERLQQHLQKSHISQQEDTETPLDAFFYSFPAFDYNPSLPPATSFSDLRRHERWRFKSAESEDAWDRYQEALQSELHLWYGAENNLTAWHTLCRAIGVEPLPPTCEQCETVGDPTMRFDKFADDDIGCAKKTCQYH